MAHKLAAALAAVLICLTPAVARAQVSSHAFITNGSNGDVAVIDDATHTAVPVPVGDTPFGIAVTPDSRRAYITQQFGGAVAVIDVATNTLIGSPIPVVGSPAGIAIAPDGLHAYVALNNLHQVAVIDLTTNMRSTTIPLPDGPVIVERAVVLECERRRLGRRHRRRGDALAVTRLIPNGSRPVHSRTGWA
jgi:YVTN family beta-propeller protein